MKNYAKRRVASKATKSKKRTAYTRRSNSNRILTRVVKKVLHSQIENKKVLSLIQNQTIASYLVLPGLYTVPLIPYTNIAQGTGQSDRIGNKIKTMKCMLHYILTPYPQSVTLNPVPRPHNVIIMIGKVKNAKPQLPIASDYAQLYELNNAGAAPSGTLLDCCLPVNKDYFTIYKKVIHKVGYESFNNAGVSPTQQHYANNDYKLNIIGNIDITKHCPKTLIFNDSTQQPQNDGLYMWAFCVPSDGSAYAALTPILMTNVIKYEYEDA